MSAAVRALASVVLASLILSACSSGATVLSAPSASTASPGELTISTASTPALGSFLTGSGGMTLYIFTKDHPDQTTCSGSCAQIWPPLTVAPGQQPHAGPGVTGRLGTLARPDGGIQVTYEGMPLYYFMDDSRPGDTIGQGKDGVWFVAPTSGSAPPASSTPLPASSPSPSGGGSSY